MLRDAIGRDWQCGTTQVDFNLPERFGAFYVDHDGQKKTPSMVHRAICGSMERFAGILIEHFAGHFPLWLAPGPGRGRDHHVGRRRLCQGGRRSGRDRAGLRVEADLRNEKITYKVREHSLAKVPVLLVVGKEAAERTSRSAASDHRSKGRKDWRRRSPISRPRRCRPTAVRTSLRMRAAPRSISPSTAITSSRGPSPDAASPRRGGAVPGPAPAFPVDVGGGEPDVPELLFA